MLNSVFSVLKGPTVRYRYCLPKCMGSNQARLNAHPQQNVSILLEKNPKHLHSEDIQLEGRNS